MTLPLGATGNDCPCSSTVVSLHKSGGVMTGTHPHVHEAENLRAHMRIHLKQLIKLALPSTRD